MGEEIELWNDGRRRIIGVTGDLFEESDVEAIVAYKPIGLVAFPFEREKFFERLGPHRVDGDVHLIDGLQGRVKFVINGWSQVDDLSFCHRLGVHSVSMNGIRTDGYGERDNVADVLYWWQCHPGTRLTNVRLVDLRGGFVRLGKLRTAGKRVDGRGYSTDFESLARKRYIEDVSGIK